MTELTDPSIRMAAREIVTDLAPDELDFFDTVVADFFADSRTRRHCVRVVLAGRERDEPIGFDVAAGLQAITVIVLTILNGVACEVLAATTTQRVGWWWRRRRVRRLSAQVAPAGADAPLPRMSSVDAAVVGRLAQQIASDSKVGLESAQRIGTLVAAALTRAAD